MSVRIRQSHADEPGFGSLLWRHPPMYRWECFMCRRLGEWTGEGKANDDGLAHEGLCRSNVAQMAPR